MTNKTFKKSNSNASKFTKKESSPLERLGSFVSKNVLPEAREFARETAMSLISQGMSINTVTELSSRRAESIVSGAAEEFFRMASSRESLEKIKKNRVKKPGENIASHPSAKIRESQKKYDTIVVAVL